MAGILIISKERTKILLFHKCFSYFVNNTEYKNCFKILGISENCDQEEIRKAYLNLVKRYHPDSGTPEADADKFSQIDRAFKILINKKSKERWGVEDQENKVQEQDIQHTAPQHRQYLNYDGVGSGTPFQRQKQYTKMRSLQAANNVLKHRIAKVSAEEGALLDKSKSQTPLNHKIKTKYGLDRLVEDLIQESMSKGEFSNLSGVGKPLKNLNNRNPYVDFVTHKLNEVLIDNGFTPDWIMLQKELRNELEELRNSLLSERMYFGDLPLNKKEEDEWKRTITEKYQETVDGINKKINRFNLLVPILHKQMIQISLAKEANKALINGKSDKKLNLTKENLLQEEKPSNSSNIFDFIDSLFKK